MEINWDDLKLPVGRPTEEQMPERKDLTKYITQQKFVKRWTKYFRYWEKAVELKAKKVGKLKYIDYAQEFYGEVIDKFESLPEGQQEWVAGSIRPIARLYELTNLSEPNLFYDKENNEAFIDVIKEAEF